MPLGLGCGITFGGYGNVAAVADHRAARHGS